MATIARRNELGTRRASRRQFLRGAVIAGAGLIGAALVGCGDGPAASASPGSPDTGAGTPNRDDQPFFLYQEVLTADRPSQYGYIAPKGCVPSSEFRRGERIVFRFEILQKSTGTLVTDQDADASNVRLHLASGEVATGDYKQRGEGRVADAPWTWDICWDVPPTYPLGSLDYFIEVTTNDGVHGTWRPPSLIDPTRGIDSRPRIVPGNV